MWQSLLLQLSQGNIKALARAISLIENEVNGFEELLQLISFSNKKVIGITGPPGAGKSTLTDALIGGLLSNNQSVAVLCIDPSSPFYRGALLGDRIRMSEWYTHPKVFIRSLATRGSLGGLHPKIIEISDLVKAAPYDHIIIETVGVGQSEIEIAGLADTTVVVVMPEAGDDVQAMKAGLMEIADIFVVNKSDRPEADHYVRNLRSMMAPDLLHRLQEVAVIKTIATQKKGIDELLEKINMHQATVQPWQKRSWLLAEKAYFLIRNKRMKHVDKKVLQDEILHEVNENKHAFNLYRFILKYR